MCLKAKKQNIKKKQYCDKFKKEFKMVHIKKKGLKMYIKKTKEI